MPELPNTIEEKMNKKLAGKFKIPLWELSEAFNLVVLNAEDSPKELRSKLEKASIARLKDKHITKIIEIKPKDIESIKVLFASETIPLKQEELQKILECLK